MPGYIHVYTGNGKGKTTAAFGLSLRAAGAGKKVFFAQFVKGKIYSEIEAVQKYLPQITVKQYGLDCFIYNQPEQKDIDAALIGLPEVELIIEQGLYNIVVLDEANIALYYKLFTVNQLLQILDKKHPETEIIITGRYAPTQIIDKADLVTEMREIKHYYNNGVQARQGIEF